MAPPRLDGIVLHRRSPPPSPEVESAGDTGASPDVAASEPANAADPADAADPAATEPTTTATLQTSADTRGQWATETGYATQAQYWAHQAFDSPVPLAATGAATGAPPAMSGEEAIEILDRDFDTFDAASRVGRGGHAGRNPTNGRITTGDLEAVANNNGDRYTEEQQQAAQVLLDSDAYRSFADVGAGRGRVDGKISRGDLEGALDAIDSGAYYDELLDTAAARGGRNGHVSDRDVDAALSDPSVPDEVKDALRLMRQSSEGIDNFHDALEELNTNDINAISRLVQSPAFSALNEDSQTHVADAVRRSGGRATRTIDRFIDTAEFQAASPDAQAAQLGVLGSQGYADLTASQRTAVRNILAGTDPNDVDVADNLNGLLANENFENLNWTSQTSILAQIDNYPDARSVADLNRMIDREWFQDQSVEDQQRSAKVIAHLAQHDGGDRTIIENTLDALLDSDDGFSIVWEDLGRSNGRANLRNGLVRLHEDKVAADNNPIQGRERHIVESTLAHEVNHLTNEDRVDETFEYLNEEYRAWYVGELTQNGSPPTIQQAVDRWEFFLSPGNSYSDESLGEGSIGDPDYVAGALDKPAEAQQIFDLLSDLTGVEVTLANYTTVLADSSMWTTNARDPAPDTHFPATDDLDN